MNRVAYQEVHHSDRMGAKIGMWLFLFTEILLFGGLFLLYAVYRFKYAMDFHFAASELNRLMGTINTLILLTSSLTVAVSIAALDRGNKKLAVILLIITIIFGGVFLTNKYHEWSTKFEHQIYPGSPGLENRSPGEQNFYALYFVMTGLHAIHVIAGIIILAIVTFMVMQNPYKKITLSPHQIRHLQGSRLGIYKSSGDSLLDIEQMDESIRHLSVNIFYDDSRKEFINESDIIKLENAGLYWHLVDVIWIFLFPLFYLIT